MAFYVPLLEYPHLCQKVSQRQRRFSHQGRFSAACRPAYRAHKHPANLKHRGARSQTNLVETSRAYGRGICRGVARFAEQHPDWMIIYQERNLKESIPESLRKYKVDGILMRVDRPALARDIVSLGETDRRPFG